MQVVDQFTISLHFPIKMDIKKVGDFVNLKKDWIERKISECKDNYRIAKNFKLKNRQGYLIAGKRVDLPEARNLNSKELHEFYKKLAHRMLSKIVFRICEKEELICKKIKINSARRRWGSCCQKNINFSWRLILAPQKIIEYVAIHEICHLRFKNHSKKYWEYVESLMPDYMEAEEWLKKHGFILSIN